MSEFQYALWWETESCVTMVEIFDTEEKAADLASVIEAETDGYIHGVVRSDGKIERPSSWPMFLEMKAKKVEGIRQQLAKSIPRRKITNPFIPQGYAWVEKDMPGWIVGENRDGQVPT